MQHGLKMFSKCDWKGKRQLYIGYDWLINSTSELIREEDGMVYPACNVCEHLFAFYFPLEKVSGDQSVYMVE
jgi:hypothetical protein